MDLASISIHRIQHGMRQKCQPLNRWRRIFLSPLSKHRASRWDCRGGKRETAKWGTLPWERGERSIITFRALLVLLKMGGFLPIRRFARRATMYERTMARCIFWDYFPAVRCMRMPTISTRSWNLQNKTICRACIFISLPMEKMRHRKKPCYLSLNFSGAFPQNIHLLASQVLWGGFTQWTAITIGTAFYQHTGVLRKTRALCLKIPLNILKRRINRTYAIAQYRPRA